MVACDRIEFPDQLRQTRRSRRAQVERGRRNENRAGRFMAVRRRCRLHQCAVQGQISIDRIDQGILVIHRWLVAGDPVHPEFQQHRGNILVLEFDRTSASSDPLSYCSVALRLDVGLS